MNPFFILQVLLLALICVPRGVFSQLPVPAGAIWEEEINSRETRSGVANLIEVWQPMGVSNLASVRFAHWKNRDDHSVLSHYHLVSVPGYRIHEGAIRVTLDLPSEIRMGQELGFKLCESGSVFPTIWQVRVCSSFHLAIPQEFRIRFLLDGWPSLFFPDSDRLTGLGMDLFISKRIGDSLKAGLSFQSKVGCFSNFILFASWDLSGSHQLYLSMGLSPLGIGLGYGLNTSRFKVLFLIDSGSSFGVSPYTSVSWGR